jgi:hypothetical protein
VSEVPEHKFPSTHFQFDPEVTAFINGMADEIPDEDGGEDQPHVTARFGLHTSDPDDVRSKVEDIGTGKLRLGKTSIFPAKSAHAFDDTLLDAEFVI